MGQLLLQVKNVSKVFGNLNALEDLSIDIEKGSVIGLVGSNGAGKTTLLRLLCGLYRPTKGDIFFLISRDSNSLVMINTTTDKIISRIEVQEQPHHVALLSDSVAVTNTESQSISIVDFRELEVVNNIKIDADPLMIVSDKDERIIVGAIRPAKLFFIDNEEVKNSINLESDPHGIALTADGENVIVTLPEEDKVLIINMKGEIIKELQTGDFPHNIDIDPNGKYGYISNSNDASVSIMDLTNFEIVATIETGNGSHNVQFYNIMNSNTQINTAKDGGKIISANFNCGG